MKKKEPRLMRERQWVKREFTECSQPDTRTVKAMIRSGKIRGRIIDSRAYVFEDQKFGICEEASNILSQL